MRDGLTNDETLQCELCNSKCLLLHNCTEAPHSSFDMYDGMIYCVDCVEVE